MSNEIKFPFEPSERVKAAFRNEVRLRQAITLMTEALIQATTDMPDVWAIVRQDHPELTECERNGSKVSYNHLTQTFNLYFDPWKDISKEKPK